MKTFLTIALALTALTCLTPSAEAKTYSVKNIGKGGLRTACGNGGGSFQDGENSYSCTYPNGNIRECSKRDGHCITETPPKRIVPTGLFDPVNDNLEQMSEVDGGEKGDPSTGNGINRAAFANASAVAVLAQ